MKELIKKESLLFLRHISLTFFQANAKLGAILIVVLALFSWQHALFGVLGAILCEAFGRALKPNRLLKESGLFAMNGFFVGMSLPSFFQGNLALGIWLVFVAMMCAMFVVLSHRILATWQLPVLVLPYVLAFWMIWSLRLQSNQLVMKEALPLLSAPEGVLGNLQFFLTASLNSFAEIFFQANPWFGVVVLAALSRVNWRMGLTACAGAMVATLVAMVMGAPVSNIGFGYYGFSGVLVAVALTVGTRGMPRPIVWGAVATVTPASMALAQVLAPLGLFALSIPYILLVWAAYLLRPIDVVATRFGFSGGTSPYG